MASFAPSLCFQKKNVYQCPRCVYVGTRLGRIREHGVAKHGLATDGDDAKRYLATCLNLSKRGWRLTSETRVTTLLGKFGGSRSHRRAAVAVLRGHLVRVEADDPSTRVNRCLQRTLPKCNRGRAMATECIRASDLTPTFVSGELCGLARSYIKAQANRDLTRNHILGNAKMIHRIVLHNMKFLATMDEQEAVVSRPAGRQFLEQARVVFRPCSIRNHCNAIISLFEISKYDQDMVKLFSDYGDSTVDCALDLWRGLKKSWDKQVRREQRLKVMTGDLPRLPLYDILLFLQAARDKGETSRMLRELQAMPRGSREVPPEVRTQWNFIQAIIATYLLLQGQRLVAVQNMTVDEVTSASQFGGSYVIRIRTHKTSKYGPSVFALKPHQYQILNKFSKIRKRMSVPRTELLISVRGNTAVNLLHPLYSAIGADVRTVSHSIMRKVLESNCYLIGEGILRDSRSSELNRYLCHNKEVSDVHYKYRTDRYVIAAARTAEQIVSHLLAVEMSKERLVEKDDNTHLIPGES